MHTLSVDLLMCPDSNHDDHGISIVFFKDDAKIETRRERPFAFHSSLQCMILEFRIKGIFTKSDDGIRYCNLFMFLKLSELFLKTPGIANFHSHSASAIRRIYEAASSAFSNEILPSRSFAAANTSASNSGVNPFTVSFCFCFTGNGKPCSISTRQRNMRTAVVTSSPSDARIFSTFFLFLSETRT